MTLHPVFSRFLQVVREHRAVLDLPGSPSGWLTGLWAKVMVFPQALAPLLVLLGAPVLDVALIFAARFAAMHVVWLLDRSIANTRALGLCHLVTFGPLAVYFGLEFEGRMLAWGSLGSLFLAYFAVILVCLYLDLRDLVLHMAGRPYPAYIRDHHRNGHLMIDDPKAEEPVTAWNRIFW